MTLSVVIITYNEEANIGRTLESVKPLVGDGKGEIIVVDSGSTDRTVEIARSHGANVFVEEWKGYAAQKNSAIEKATGDWILSLDADEQVSADLAAHINRSAADDHRSPFEWNIAPALDVEYENLRTDLSRKHFGLLARTIFSAAGSSTADTSQIKSSAYFREVALDSTRIVRSTKTPTRIAEPPS